nr:PREDICTED: CST complex subunit STN1 [Musa acuminata subsp. malaccensis]
MGYIMRDINQTDGGRIKKIGCPNVLKPLMAVHVKLLAADLLSLAVHYTSRPPSFTRKGKPVSRAEAVGVVVSRERKDKYLSFLVDDGSGCIPCILWLNHQSDRERDLGVAAEMAREEAAAVQLGKLVRVRGRITAYRGVVQITVGDVVVERDPNSEVLHWLDCVRLAKFCYDPPP